MKVSRILVLWSSGSAPWVDPLMVIRGYGKSNLITQGDTGMWLFYILTPFCEAHTSFQYLVHILFLLIFVISTHWHPCPPFMLINTSIIMLMRLLSSICNIWYVRVYIYCARTNEQLPSKARFTKWHRSARTMNLSSSISRSIWYSSSISVLSCWCEYLGRLNECGRRRVVAFSSMHVIPKSWLAAELVND